MNHVSEQGDGSDREQRSAGRSGVFGCARVFGRVGFSGVSAYVACLVQTTEKNQINQASQINQTNGLPLSSLVRLGTRQFPRGMERHFQEPFRSNLCWSQGGEQAGRNWRCQYGSLSYVKGLFQARSFLSNRVAWSILVCARRTSTF